MGPELKTPTSYRMDRPVRHRPALETPVPGAGSSRLPWILGVLLLVGTAFGAGWVLNQESGGRVTDEPNEKLHAGIVLCQGKVDIEPGVAKLITHGSGRVTWVAPEGEEVRKGEPILQIEKKWAKLDVDQARADLDLANLNLTKAQNDLELFPQTIAQQEAALGIAKDKKDEADAFLRKVITQFETKHLNENDKKIAEANVNQAEGLIKVEQAKLKALKASKPELKVSEAEIALRAKQAQLDRAKEAERECDLLAPSAGRVLRAYVNVGESVSPASKLPAIEFAPTAPFIVRAEVLQEWASRVKVGQECVIEDDTTGGPKWTGKVTYVADWFAPKRDKFLEPYIYNDVQTLDCKIEVHSNPDGPPLRIGQRVRVMIKTEK